MADFDEDMAESKLCQKILDNNTLILYYSLAITNGGE